MQDSPRGKKRLIVQRQKKRHVAKHILSLFPEAKEVVGGRKLTIIIPPGN